MMPYSDEWTVEKVVNPDFGKETDYLFPESLEKAPGSAEQGVKAPDNNNQGSGD
jgi:hypothetical protein